MEVGGVGALGQYVVQYAFNLDSSKKVTSCDSQPAFPTMPIDFSDGGGITAQPKCV